MSELNMSCNLPNVVELEPLLRSKVLDQGSVVASINATNVVHHTIQLIADVPTDIFN